MCQTIPNHPNPYDSLPDSKGNLVFGSRPSQLAGFLDVASGLFWGFAYTITDLIIFANPNAETVNGAYSFLLVDQLFPTSLERAMILILDAYLLACINMTLPQSLLTSIYFLEAPRGILAR